MKIISFIEDEEVIEKILKHVSLWDVKVRPPPKVKVPSPAPVSMANGGMYKNKVCVAVAAVRRAGAIHTLDGTKNFFLSAEIRIVDQGTVFGMEKGEVENNEESIQRVKGLGQRMAWL